MSETPDFLGEKPKKPRQSRAFARGFSIFFLGFALVFGGVSLWFSYDQSTWSEADATVVSREKRRKGIDLRVEFETPTVGTTTFVVREWQTVRAVGDAVRIRYDVRSSGEVRNARLAEEPISEPEFLVGAAGFAIVGLGLVYWSWFRMPPDGKPRSPRR
ncbi:hypothetical protein DMH04_36825 [Kibdelosporangium aridum]|uniref:DUF3592 domain-containing protein n=1 Tax=Kibdelosporangium aridum TaxID=2030 RepID=A0A428YZG2_KIBAR|nr:DUF3592 domain-containing protein [Kibdelosporangium aridum]RSM76068.1 hypothetical protein DMH04_36825 [Kibdelosporangium aridum]